MPLVADMSGALFLQVTLLCAATAAAQHSAGAQECPGSATSRRTAGGTVFLERWPQDEKDPFAGTCCGDLFHCGELRATCLQCGEARCRPNRVCPDNDCRTFGVVCDQRRDCSDGSDESHCGDIVRSYSVTPEEDITATELVIYGVSLETCAAYCFFHPDKCQVFSYSNSSGDGQLYEGVSQREQISLGRPLYSSRCHIGCQACGLSAVRRPGFTLYGTRQQTGVLRLQLQLTRAADDPARQLLPRHPVCGQRQHQQTDVTALIDRVVGGRSSLRGEFPWQAQINSINHTSNRWEHTCGGVIISERFVLTAAHCMLKALSEYEVRVGEYDLRVRERSELVFGIKEKLDVPDYGVNGSHVGDLTVLLLDFSNQKAISFSAEVRPACLIRPEDAAPAVHSPCVISGWGRTLPGYRETPYRLRGAEVPIVSDAFCSSPEAYGSKFVPERMVCAGFVTGGVDTCQGDSGGGLVCPAPDGSWQVVGIVSTGDGCGTVGKPGIYTELQPYYEKILDILKALS